MKNITVEEFQKFVKVKKIDLEGIILDAIYETEEGEVSEKDTECSYMDTFHVIRGSYTFIFVGEMNDESEYRATIAVDSFLQ